MPEGAAERADPGGKPPPIDCREEITGLRRLVEDFSAFAKLPKVEPTPLDLVPLVEEIVRLQPEWQAMVKVESSAPVFAPCDKLLFRRVIANLVENALQAAQAAGREPQVVIRVQRRPDSERAAILVDDNGPVFPRPSGSGCSIPMSPSGRAAPAWAWPSCARS